MSGGTMIEVGELARMLAASIDRLVLDLLPGGRRNGAEWVALCPWRGDRRVGSFSVHLSGPKAGLWGDFSAGEYGDALDLVAKAVCGGSKADAIRWARRWLGIDTGDTAALERARRAVPSEAERDQEAEAEAQRARDGARRLWLHASPKLLGTPVDWYLRGRGIALDELGRLPGAVRFHPNLWHTDTRSHHPAMVTAIAGPGGQIGTHRTYLRITGPARAEKLMVDGSARAAKKVLGQFKGGHIALWRGASGKALRDAPKGEVVDIVEGIEDGLSLAVAVPELRVVAAVSLGNMASVALPPQVEVVRLWRDADTGKQAIAAFDRAIQAHLSAGRRVRVAAIDGVKDINEALQQDLREAAHG